MCGLFWNWTFRLSDEQMQSFEGMMSEAQTLQTYLDNLESHHEDVKGSIYHKLSIEYIARKTVIFKADEFLTLHTDVQHDLQDMTAKREEFVEKVERLNEELEEIKVRHLVGEYNEETLAEKEEAQTNEIALWNEKVEKIEQFITRCQQALDAENALNPIKNKQIQEEVPQEEPEEVSPSLEDVEASEPSEDTEDETLSQEETAPEISREPQEPEEEGSVKEKIDLASSEESEEEETSEEADVTGDDITGLELDEQKEDFEIPETEEPEEAEEGVLSFGGAAGFEEEAEDENFDADFSIDSEEFDEDEFELDSLTGLDEEDEEEFSYDIEGFGDEEIEHEEETAESRNHDCLPKMRTADSGGRKILCSLWRQSSGSAAG